MKGFLITFVVAIAVVLRAEDTSILDSEIKIEVSSLGESENITKILSGTLEPADFSVFTQAMTFIAQASKSSARGSEDAVFSELLSRRTPRQIIILGNLLQIGAINSDQLNYMGDDPIDLEMRRQLAMRLKHAKEILQLYSHKPGQGQPKRRGEEQPEGVKP